MRDMAGRFEVHAQTVEDEARRMWASAQKLTTSEKNAKAPKSGRIWDFCVCSRTPE